MSLFEVDLVTVDRECGAGGSDFALQLGDRLGWPVLDRAIVHRVADRLRLDSATVAQFDEHPPSLLDRIATTLYPQHDSYLFPPTPDLPRHDVIADATTAFLEEAGRSPPLIIVGHGSQCLFGSRPHSLHVRLIALLTARIQRVALRTSGDLALAAAHVRRTDHDRKAYVKRYFDADLRSASLYHVQFNTDRVRIEDAVSMVVGLVASGPAEGFHGEDHGDQR